MYIRIKTSGFAAGLAMLSMFLASPAWPSVDSQANDGKIVFSNSWSLPPSTPGGSGTQGQNLYVLYPDSKVARQITPQSPQVSAGSPAWSPDGRHIAAYLVDSSSNPDAISGIAVMDDHGGNLHYLPAMGDGSMNRAPLAWSPNMAINKIAFASYSANSGGVCLSLANPDGSGAADLFCPPNVTNYSTGVNSIVWSKDGSALLVTIQYSDYGQFDYHFITDIYEVGLDGSTRLVFNEQVADPYHQVSNVSWSPDRSWIVFADGSTGVFRVDVETGTKTPLAPDSLNPGFNPLLSPDGRQIVFEKYDPLGQGPSRVSTDLYVMNADGSGLQPLTAPVTDPANSGHFYNPGAWSADGKRLLVYRNDYTVSNDGTQVAQTYDLNIITVQDGSQVVLLQDNNQGPGSAIPSVQAGAWFQPLSAVW